MLKCLYIFFYEHIRHKILLSDISALSESWIIFHAFGQHEAAMWCSTSARFATTLQQHVRGTCQGDHVRGMSGGHVRGTMSGGPCQGDGTVLTTFFPHLYNNTFFFQLQSEESCRMPGGRFSWVVYSLYLVSHTPCISSINLLVFDT